MQLGRSKSQNQGWFEGFKDMLYALNLAKVPPWRANVCMGQCFSKSNETIEGWLDIRFSYSLKS